MNTINIPLPQIQAILLIFVRVASILMAAPLFESKNIPLFFKAALSFSIALILLPIIEPIIKINGSLFDGDIIVFVIGMTGEIIIGVIIGFSVKLIFAGFQLAGSLIGVQMGLGMANVMDPVTSSQVPLMGHFNYLLAMLIFLAINAHHWFLRAIVESFRLIPPFNFHFSNSLFEHLIELSSNMFVVAIKTGAPVIAALLLASVALGLIARTVPQMNVFFVAMPIKIILGLFVFCVSIPLLSSYFKQIFLNLGDTIFILLKSM